MIGPAGRMTALRADDHRVSVMASGASIILHASSFMSS